MTSSKLILVILSIFLIFMFYSLNQLMNDGEPVSENSILVTYLGPINDQFLFKDQDGKYLSLRKNLLSSDIDLNIIDQRLTLNVKIMNVPWLYQPLFKEDTLSKYTGVVK